MLKSLAFNTDGKNSVSKTSISKYGARFAVDLDLGTPNWVTGYKYSRIRMYLSDNTGASRDPKLFIIYTISTSGFIPQITNII